ncbi:two-partner secretion domain-containing protein [Tardiphaga alba]|nr:filamentous hemagglutinin N-terminal domain-containing protein [Tardiphaga alba]
MFVRNAAVSHSQARAIVRRRILWATVSTVALSVMPASVHARALGGGSTGAVSAPNIAADAAALAARQAATAVRQTQDSLSRAARAVQDIQAVQAAARAAAAAAQVSQTRPVAVPNGLAPGGLVQGPGSWTNANGPTQSIDSSGQTQVKVQQTGQQAILDWSSFNIGSRTTLTFDQQGKADWVAVNRVSASTAPIQILGNIKADGQVYVINQSGIIFGGNSQVNVGSLIVAAAAISPEQLSKGLYSNQSGQDWTPSFTDALGEVRVEAGAQIATKAPTSVTSGGGFVMLLGQSVVNDGMISTPKGQALLAAGDSFILRHGFSTTGNTASTTRGAEVSPVINAGSSSGRVVNSGLIFAQQGDITLAGRDLLVGGALISTSSVNTRGTIHLLNRASDTAGKITLAAGSVTAILPELDSGETALDSARNALIAASLEADKLRFGSAAGVFDNLSRLSDRQDQSRIEIVTGGSVSFAGGSYTAAQGGQIAVSAAKTIDVADGALLDVSGVRNVALAMSSNNIRVNVQGNELRDSPQNRDNGALTSNDVWIDARYLTFVAAGTGGYASDRYYTPGGLLEVGGYLNTTAHTIGEWAAIGGSITLQAPELTAHEGARFDISGGSLDVAAGWIRSTNLIGSDGRRYSVDNAPADMKFVGFAGSFSRTHNIQGKVDDRLTEVWFSVFDRGRNSLRWEEGYSVGRDAGRLNLAAPTAKFAATIVADTVTGEQQTSRRNAGVTDGYKLSHNVVAQNGTLALQIYEGSTGVPRWTALDSAITFSDAPAPSDRTGTVWLSSDLLTSFNLGGISAWSTKGIAVDSALAVAAGGVIDFQAANVTIAADVTARSGTVTIGNLVPGSSPLLDGTASSHMTLRNGAVIDTRGVWSNALLDETTSPSAEAYIDGGDVTISTTLHVTLETGSRIDASAGGMVSPRGKFKGGSGGDITLIASASNASGTGQLTLGGQLVSTGFAKGGALTLDTGGAVVIGGAVPTQPQTLHLAADFFSQGFSSYAINGQKSLTVAADAAVNVTRPTYQATSALYELASGGDVATAAATVLQPLYLDNAMKGSTTQRAGADLLLRSGGRPDFAGTNSAITIAQGASITVDPGRKVELVSAGQITVLGRITAHAGRIEIRDGNAGFPSAGVTSPYTAYDPGARSIWIGETAVLDVSAQAHVARDVQGGFFGIVADGGKIIIGGTGAVVKDSTVRNSAISHVVIRSGAILDASGTAGELTVSDINGTRTIMAGSNGGSITIASRSSIYMDGTLRAQAGSANASGGSLSVFFESPLFAETNASFVPAYMRAARILTIGQSAVTGDLAAGARPGVADPTLVIGHGHITADTIMASGADSVQLWTRGGISFDGNVNLATGRSLTLSHSGFITNTSAGQVWNGDIANTTAGATVRLKSAYVGLIGLGVQKDTLVFADILPAMPAGGLLEISAGLIDLQSDIRFKYADTVLVSRGDIRVLATPGGLTTIGTSGNLTLTAQQVYPASGASATLFAGMNSTGTTITDMNAVLRILSVDGSRPAAPYSVFGSLSLTAPTILQGGVLRAPLGSITLGKHIAKSATDNFFTRVELLAGSLTSVSAAGLIMPYGGTTDGVNYTADGVAAITPDLMTGAFGTSGTRLGVAINASEVTSAAGSVIDLSGGGTLTGAGFVSGRGGSVDVLVATLADANPANRKYGTGNAVYALVPGVVTAPVTGGYNTAWTGNAPGIGQQVTIPAGVPGLAAGTYTLMPANYALLPGAFRVEIASSHVTATTAPIALANGSYLASGMLGIANTSIRDALQTTLILTPGNATRSYAKYNEQNYTDFQLAQSARFGTTPTLLERDGKFLSISLMALDGGNPTSTQQRTRDALVFEGRALFAADDGGYGGTLNLGVVRNVYVTGSQSTLQIVKAGSIVNRTSMATPVSDATIAAIGAPNINIGGVLGRKENTVGWDYTQTDQIGTWNVIVDSGVVLRGSQIILAALRNITIASGARVDTLGWGVQAPDSNATGLTYGGPSLDSANSGNMAAVVAVSNGTIAFSAPIGTAGNVTIGDGATLVSEGSIGFLVPGSLTVNGTPVLGTRSLNLTVPTLNVGTAASLDAARAAGTLPTGLAFDQSLFDRLLAGGAGAGAPALETLVLGASNSINFFGSVSLDAIDPLTGRSRLKQFQLNTPAIYGAGSAGDQVRISADTLIWNGYATTVGNATQPSPSKTPGATTPGGAGNGAGTITIDARRVVLGFGPNDRSYSQVNYDRLMLGFSAVTLSASEAIVANNRGTLAVFASGPSPDNTYNSKTYAGVGGALNLVTPLLTGDPGAVLSIRAGGDVRLTRPVGASEVKPAAALGADIAITAGESLYLDSTIYLPSGRFSGTAGSNVTLGANSKLDLSGQAIPMLDVTKYSWGGDVLLESRFGEIRQMAGSVIDISAANNDAGSLTLTATSSSGRVILGGTLKATGVRGGSIDLRARLIGAFVNTQSEDFAALNIKLSEAGFTERRSFVLKQGNLVIGNELKAHDISVSVDDGMLTVNGKIDASGERAGSIRLWAIDDVILTNTAVLDAHGTVLQVDSDGNAIAAKNRALVEVGSTYVGLQLDSGAVIDVSSPDGVSRGTFNLYAPRFGGGTSATGAGAPYNAIGYDIPIEIGTNIDIRGAREIAVYGETTYKNAPVDPNTPGTQVIDKAFLDKVDRDSTAFINAALANSDLMGRLAGLTAYGSAFHLRPGVTIASATPTGNLIVSGDIDLSAYRYGPNAERDPGSATYGSGEAMGLTLRAGGNLTVRGNLSDGYRTTAQGTPATFRQITILNNSTDFVTNGTRNVTLPSGTRVSIPYYRNRNAISLVTDWTVPTTDYYVYGTSGVTDSTGKVWSPGSIVPAGTTFSVNQLQLVTAEAARWPTVQYVTPAQAPQYSTPLAGAATQLRVVAGSDLNAAAARTLAAASTLANRGNIILNNPMSNGSVPAPACYAPVPPISIFSRAAI